MKKKVVSDNSEIIENSIEDYKKDAKQIGIFILILVFMIIFFVLKDIFFNEIFDSFVGILIDISLSLLFIIAFRKILWRAIKWFMRLIFEGVSEQQIIKK